MCPPTKTTQWPQRGSRPNIWERLMSTNRKEFIFPLKILYIPLLLLGPFIDKLPQPVPMSEDSRYGLLSFASAQKCLPLLFLKEKERTSPYLNNPVKFVKPSWCQTHVKSAVSQLSCLSLPMLILIVVFLSFFKSRPAFFRWPVWTTAPHWSWGWRFFPARRAAVQPWTWWKVTRGEVTAGMKPQDV